MLQFSLKAGNELFTHTHTEREERERGRELSKFA